MGELQQIKLENDMLREEVKLLNYAMEEKDAKIDLLKN
jgi:cell division protein FtsB